MGFEISGLLFFFSIMKFYFKFYKIVEDVGNVENIYGWIGCF